MDGDALEVAIALSRSPAMRQALRQRPLPPDVGEVIELAAGAPGPLAAAAVRTGERPEQLLEAVRFYLREVLLFSGADAYRVLGVSSQAGAAQIKGHHRALQQWLHPDRRGNDWEAIYATRINAAWSELRSTQRRVAYDLRRQQETGPFGAHPSGRHGGAARWRMVPNARARWPAWMALVAVFAGCIWLVILLDRQANAPAPEWLPPAADARDAARHQAPETSPLPVAPEMIDAKDVVEPLAAAELPVSPAIVDVAAPINAARAAPIDAHDPTNADVQGRVSQTGAIGHASGMKPHPLVVQPSSPSGRPIVEAPSITATESPGTVVDTASASASPAAALVQSTSVDPRLRLAQRQARELTRYLTSRTSHVPPIWRSAMAQDAAALIRDQLESRQARFGDPAWRIAADRATMTSAIVTPDDASGAATLRVDMDWRDGMWWVAAIETDSLP